MNTKNALQHLGHLDGRRFCVVYMEVLDAAANQVKLSAVHGVAAVLEDRLAMQCDHGIQVTVPDSALGAVFKSDGNEVLKDAEYYAIVKVAERENC